MRLTRISALIGTAAVALLTAACGSSTTPTPGPAASPTTTTLPPVSAPTAAGTFGTRPPVVTVPTGPPPTVLQASDLITGTGAVAKKGSTVTVQYVLVSYATDAVIQSSWDSSSFSFKLGEGQVIPGWDKGVVGMKVGGRRELIIPPALGYGSMAQQGIPPNSTLVFIVDVLKVA